MNRQAVLIVSTSYPLAGDGSEAAGAFVADFVSALNTEVPVRVVGPGLTEAREQGSVVPTWRFSAGERPLSLLSPWKPWNWLAIIRTLRSLRRQVAAAVEDGQVAHIHALWILPCGWAARAVARETGATYSVWALGSDIWSLGRLPHVRRLLSLVARDAHAAYADGLLLARDAEELTGRSFDFMPSCRSLSGKRRREVATAPPYKFLYLGRWHPNKGTDLLLDALDALSEDDWMRIDEVHIAGGGPLGAMVEARARRLTEKGRPIRVSGYLDRAGAEEALSNADRLLLPSRIESIPVVFSDAVTYGVPVVSAPVGDMPNLLAEGGGWIASAVTSEAFLAEMRASLDPSQSILDALPALRERFCVGKIASSFYAALPQAAS